MYAPARKRNERIAACSVKASLPVVATLPRVPPTGAGEGKPLRTLKDKRQKHEANRHDQGARLRVGKD